MKSIGIFTKDFSLYYDLIKALRRRKVAYVSLTSLNNIPTKIGVILTSHNELHDVKSTKVIAADAYDSIDHAIDLALQMLIGKELYSKVYIGIDPGENPGIAIVGDDVLLNKTTINDPEKIKDLIKRFIREYPANQTIIRIGHGSIIIRNRIINSLIPLGVSIEIVDETKTSSNQQRTRHERDEEAAAAIALITGGRVQKRLPLKPTKGEIKSIQEKSRKITNGEFTISEKKAIEVLNGKISLINAIKQDRDRKNPKRL